MTTPKRPASTAALRGRRKKHELELLDFYRVLDHLTSGWRPYFVTLLITGLRVSQLCELQPESLDHEAKTVRVKDSKVPTGVRTISVAEEFWFWILAANAVPITPWHLRDQWNGAVERAG